MAAVFSQTVSDLEEMERITEAKIEATMNRDAKALVALLQEQIDPMYRLNSHTLDLSTMTEQEKADLRTRISRWASREQYLKDLLEQNLGYIEYLKQLLGISGAEHSGLNVGL